MSEQGQDAAGQAPEGAGAYRRLVGEWNAAFNARDAEKYASFYAEEAVVADPAYREPLRGREAVQQDITTFMETLPDAVAHVQEILVDGTTVAARGVITGTQTGPMPTPSGEIPPTGRSVKVPMGFFIHFDPHGRIVEEYRYYDLAGMAAQPEGD